MYRCKRCGEGYETAEQLGGHVKYCNKRQKKEKQEFRMILEILLFFLVLVDTGYIIGKFVRLWAWVIFNMIMITLSIYLSYTVVKKYKKYGD